MTGWGEYDLLGPSTFMVEGRPGRIRSLLHGFGYTDADMDSALSHRLFSLCLLHRFSDPVRQIQLEGWQDKAANLGELERLLWPLGSLKTT
jgi:hygromycin-B 7''-O-kinase